MGSGTPCFQSPRWPLSSISAEGCALGSVLCGGLEQGRSGARSCPPQGDEEATASSLSCLLPSAHFCPACLHVGATPRPRRVCPRAAREVRQHPWPSPVDAGAPALSRRDQGLQPLPAVSWRQDGPSPKCLCLRVTPGTYSRAKHFAFRAAVLKWSGCQHPTRSLESAGIPESCGIFRWVIVV